MWTIVSKVIVRVKPSITLASHITQAIVYQHSMTWIPITSQTVARTIAGVAIWRASFAGHIDDILEELRRAIANAVSIFEEITSWTAGASCWRGAKVAVLLTLPRNYWVAFKVSNQGNTPYPAEISEVDGWTASKAIPSKVTSEAIIGAGLTTHTARIVCISFSAAEAVSQRSAVVASNRTCNTYSCIIVEVASYWNTSWGIHLKGSEVIC